MQAFGKSQKTRGTVHGTANFYCEINNLDISPESNTGRGPVDFKISREEDKTVIEIKLTSNNKKRRCLTPTYQLLVAIMWTP